MRIGRTGIRVIEAMTKRPVVVRPNTYLVDAAKKMLEEDVGSLMVKEGDKPVGIITEKDLIKIVANNTNIKNILIKDVMSKILIEIDPDMDIYDAILKMNKECVRRLPVINKNGKLVGLLTVNDILIMQPALIDLRINDYDIKEKEDKIREGVCENCGSEGILYKNNGKLLCGACS